MKKVWKKMAVLTGAVSVILGTVASAGEVTTVKAAFNQNLNPYGFLNENNEPDGYDYAVLKAVDELLDDYEFEIVPTSIDDILLGLETGNYAIASSSLTYSAERAEKYLFTDENTGYKNFWLVTQAGRDDIQTVDDLAGKTVVDVTGRGFYLFIQQYNEAHPDAQIILEGIDAMTDADRLKYIADGLYDASALTVSAFNTVQAALNLNVELKDLAYSSATYLLLNKDQTQLQQEVNEALKTLKENGTLSELSLQYLDEDVTVDVNAQNETETITESAS